VRNSDLENVKGDVIKTARKYPAQTLIGAVVAGFLVGRIFRR